MPPQTTSADYKADVPDARTVDGFLQLLARAVRQFHTYPPASPLCADATAACHKALQSLDRPDRLVCRVTPRDLVIDETAIGAGTIVEQEIVRRLHRARVAAFEIDRAASPRDLARLCTAVIRAEEAADRTTFAELLEEQGVEAVSARMARRPEVLDVGAPSEPVRDLVGREQERRRSAAASGPVDYLYPPEKGWIRFDPTASLDAVSLVDLAVLVDDPADVAGMLLRLTDEEPAHDGNRAQALEQKFSDVAMLFGALDPKLARIMFGRLARAVLALEPERRTALLQRSILPGLLDGRADGAILRDFPDPDLAESLCLLLQLETAAPEVVAAALDRLALPDERRSAVASLVEERLKSGRVAGRPAGADADRTADQYARRLVRVDAAADRSFAEFAAFDLSLDDHAAAALADARAALDVPDLAAGQLACLQGLARLEPNPSLVETFMRRASRLFADRDGVWADLAAAVAPFRAIATDLAEARPDAAEAIERTLAEYWTKPRAEALVSLSGGGESGRAEARRVIEAFGAPIAGALLAVVEDGGGVSALPLMCEHARLLAPALAARLPGATRPAARAIVRVLGHAGAGFETAIAEQLAGGDELLVRAALKALTLIGTPRAAALVALHVQTGTPAARAAEEALWHFPPAQTAVQLRQLLGRREFVVQNPDVASRLIERAAQAGFGDLDGVLATLEGLRYRLWQPDLVRVARKARELRGR